MHKVTEKIKISQEIPLIKCKKHSTKWMQAIKEIESNYR